MPDYLSTFRFASTGGVPVAHSLGTGWTRTFRMGKVAWKIQTSLYRRVQGIFRCLEPFRRDSRVWRTDRRTDRLARTYADLAALRGQNVIYLSISICAQAMLAKQVLF